ncbi:hypothetical protein M2138_001747 [Dysgonomonadaceae bacterium PH5-43]|nr:hypothetical protein [Dysgonomonadaceae bacterium PH5-43]
MKKYIVALLLFITSFSVSAIGLDSLKVSLLTVMPRPNEVYTVYGHSALRLHNPYEGYDEVLNWGSFDFEDALGFSFRFIKGEADYFLSTAPFSYFIYFYSSSNAAVEEQILNLNNEEKEQLLKIVSENLQPENLFYRYNFLFDNCTSRIRDIIEVSTANSLKYPEQKANVTFRDLIHSCVDPYPFMAFGIDLVIGSGADSLISVREEMFLPEKLMKILDETYIEKQEEYRPLVLSKRNIVQSVPQTDKASVFFATPMFVGVLLLLICICLFVLGIKKKRLYRGFFGVLFFITALAGCVVVFLVCYSPHPCVSPNWNILWLHPFHFIALLGYCFKKSYSLISLYHTVNLLLLCFLLISWCWLPQVFSLANIPFIMSIGMASALWLVNAKKERR